MENRLSTGVFNTVRKWIYLALLIILSIQYAYSQDSLLCHPYYVESRQGAQHIDLSNNWLLTNTSQPINNLSELHKEDWINVAYPTSVQWALYEAGKLPYPYKGLNPEKYQWVTLSVWYYQKSFTISNHLRGNYIYLKFKGIDYFARVWVNGVFVGSHQGMFGGPIIEIGKELHYGGSNNIVVEVRSANYGHESSYKPEDPGKIIKPWEFTGGTGAKPFFTVGMWQGVSLEIVPKIHLALPYLVTDSIESNSRLAKLTLKTEVLVNNDILNDSIHPWQSNSDKDQNTFPQNDSLEEPVALQVNFKRRGKTLFSQIFDLKLAEGQNWIQQKLSLKNPMLWWPNGLGAQPLYTVHLKLLYKQHIIDEIGFKYGIRTIYHDYTPGPQYSDVWYPWQLVVNGEKIFVKGVDWMPADVLLNLPRSKYRWILELAKNADIQMVRVWGGGLLETSDFYDLCDSLGIMVWQDFPIANYTTEQWPMNIWESQVTQNIFRLRNRASLVDYSGGNEFNSYGFGNTTAIGVLERNLRIFDPIRMFVRASPDGGSIHTYPDMDPSWYNKIYKDVPNISETGMHSIPEAQGLYEIVDSSEFKDLGNMYSVKFAKTHPQFIEHFVEFNPNRVPRMLSRASHIDNMANPSLESIAIATQIGAGEFYQVMSEKVQSDYPVTAGLMPWVFKRPWPVVAAIHLVDGFGQPSAPYYFLKKTYENVHVMLNIERLLWKPGELFPVDVKILNLSKGTPLTDGKVSVKIFDEQFNLLYSKVKDVEIAKNPSVSQVKFERFRIPAGFHSQYFFVRVTLEDGRGKVISHSTYWPRTIPQMEDPEFYKNYTTSPMPWTTLKTGPWLKPIVGRTKTQLSLKILGNKEINKNRNNIKVQVNNTGNKPSFMTTLDISGVKRKFGASDNYFWLNPGETKVIDINVFWRTPDHKGRVVLASWNAAPVSESLNLEPAIMINKHKKVK